MRSLRSRKSPILANLRPNGGRTARSAASSAPSTSATSSATSARSFGSSNGGRSSSKSSRASTWRAAHSPEGVRHGALSLSRAPHGHMASVIIL
eukprot:581015-Prorocentrum_minimum.AAC.1